MVASPALATAASLPPELVEIVVDYIGTDEQGQISLNASVLDLAAASLVCVEWANSCRRRHLEVALVPLKSPSDLQTLELFTTNGSPRLDPLHSLVRFLTVEQGWNSRSWCHTLSTSAFYRMAASAGNVLEFITLILMGPVPAHLPIAAYHSPTWNLPRTLPPSFLPFTQLFLKDVRFPSLSSMLILWRSLTRLSSISCERLTWDKADVPSVDPDVNRYRRRVSLSTRAWQAGIVTAWAQDCLDNALIISLALQCHFPWPRTPFFFMDLHQRDAYLAIYNACMFTSEDFGRTERLRRASALLHRSMSSDAFSFVQSIPGVGTDQLATVYHGSTAYESGQDDESGRDWASIGCTWYCSLEHSTSNLPAHARHVVGLELDFSWHEINNGNPAGYFKKALEVFRSKLAAFPHLKVAGIRADPETILHDITLSWPELGQHPMGEAHQDLYWRWGSELYDPQGTLADAPRSNTDSPLPESP